MWIDYLAGAEAGPTGRLAEILEEGDTAGLTGVIYLPMPSTIRRTR